MRNANSIRCANSASAAFAGFLAIAAAPGASGPCIAQTIDEVMGQLHFNGESMSDYYTLGAKRSGLMIMRGTGQKLSQWATNPVTSSRTDVTWRDPNNPPGAAINVEEWSIKSNCAGGKAFLWIDAYRNDYANSPAQNRFKLETTRAEMRAGDAPWVDITNGGSCGTEGQPYALYDVTSDEYSLRVWGNIYKAGGATVGRRFFWQHRLSYVERASNPCWKTDAGTERAAVKQEEAWWDTANGWTLGLGSMEPNGEPDGMQVTLGRWQLIGKGAGSGWAGGWQGPNGENGFCLQQQWRW